MNQISFAQFSVVPGETAILDVTIAGNAFVQVGAPMVQASANRFECVVNGANIPVNILVVFPDSTPNSKVDITIRGEISGQGSGGPFPVDSVVPTSALLSPAILLVVNQDSIDAAPSGVATKRRKRGAATRRKNR